MAGGLLNLVSEGANNLIIQGGPSQKTLFRATYNKITNFLDFKSSASTTTAYVICV